MIINILNTMLLVAFMVSTLYGVITIIKNNKIKAIFKVTLIAMIALFVSRLYFLVLNISNGDVNDFSVGVLGQVSAYLFLALANKTYLPFKSKNNKVDIRAILVLIIPFACYCYSFMIVNTIGDIICSILYFCSTCLAMYFAFKNLLLVKTNKEYKKLRSFFIGVMIMTLVNSVENVILLINDQLLLAIVCSAVAITNSINIILLLPHLNKGVGKC